MHRITFSINQQGRGGSGRGQGKRGKLEVATNAGESPKSLCEFQKLPLADATLRVAASACAACVCVCCVGVCMCVLVCVCPRQMLLVCCAVCFTIHFLPLARAVISVVDVVVVADIVVRRLC